MFVDHILNWSREKGYAAVYGSPEQVNEMLTSVPFSDYKDGTAVIMHLVAESETYNGHDRAIVAVYFASLCPLDFNGESLLPEQERLKNIGKELLNDIRTGNVLAYDYPRWQYGYDDYAENVCWACLRVTITALAADCVPLPEPPEPSIARVPQAAFEWLALQGATPTLRQWCATSQTEDRPVEIAACWAVVADDDLGTLHYSDLIGEDSTQGDVTGQEINSALVEQLPSLAGMEGKWLYLLEGAAQVWDSGEVCAQASIGSVWHSGSDCWEVEVPELDVLNFYMPFGGTITLRRIGSPTVVELEYSTDGGRTWHIWEEVDNLRTVVLPADGRVWVRNTSDVQKRFSLSTSDYYKYSFTGTVEAHGNINSLLCRNAASVTTLANYCYRSMFNGCTSLTKTPELPATTLAPACYRSMFSGCTSLTKTPELPATTLANDCYYYMFYNCISLTKAPELPATTLANYCYRSMFSGCTSLTKTPELPATTLANYCYYGMFYGCDSLVGISTRMNNITASNCLLDWTNGVSPTGDFYCPPELTISTGPSGIPSGWTRHDLSELE